MKLLPVIVAVAKAQIDLPDLSNFDLSAFGLGPGTPIDFPAAGDEERYFFTTSTTPPTTTTSTTTTATEPLGDRCWKCDQMSFAGCAAEGSYTFCHEGDEDCCFVEIREKDQKLHQLCTGCKDETACMDNQAQNFEGNSFLNFQCRPDYRLQRVGRSRGRQSVCRQCFRTCDPSVDTSKCFGAIVNQATLVNIKFTLFSGQASFAANTWNGFRTEPDVDGFGIPTWGQLDSPTDDQAIQDIQNSVAGTENLWFLSPTDGKVQTDNGGARDPDDTVFWGLQGADQAWWSTNLKDIQRDLGAKTANAGTAITGGDFA